MAVINWSVEKTKLRRKGPWMPTTRTMTRVAFEVAQKAALAMKMPLGDLLAKVEAETAAARRASRHPALDATKLAFYELVVGFVQDIIEAHKEEVEIHKRWLRHQARRANNPMKRESQRFDAISSDSSDDESLISDIDWVLIQAIVETKH